MPSANCWLFALLSVGIVTCLAPKSAAQKRTSAIRHRTPFIVPISPPQFGETHRIEAKKLTWQETQRPTWDRKWEAPVGQLVVDAIVDLPSPILKDLTPAQAATTIVRAIPPDEPTTVNVAVVGPNLSALADRITNHNLTLAALEEQLASREYWRLSDLNSAVAQLQRLSQDRNVWAMYVKLLDAKDLRRLTKARTSKRTIELTQQRLFEATVNLEINPFAVSSEPTEAEARLQELGKVLDELLSKD